jgi:hypothetical protein
MFFEVFLTCSGQLVGNLDNDTTPPPPHARCPLPPSSQYSQRTNQSGGGRKGTCAFRLALSISLSVGVVGDNWL